MTDAAAHDGARLREGLVDQDNTASDVWADTAYRSKANEDYLASIGKKSRKPPGRPTARHMARAGAAKSRVRSAVEQLFAHQKGFMGLVVLTIGLARARTKIGLTNFAYNMRRMA